MNNIFFLKSFLKYLIIIFLLIFTIFLVYSKLEQSKKIGIIKTSELYNLKIIHNTIEQHIQITASDLQSLSHQSFILKMIVNQETDTNTARIINDSYISMAKYKRIYDQLRVLNVDGDELIRINYNNGLPTTTSKNNLQNKKHRYYFTNSVNLQQNEVYMSPLDLNVEHGEIELPHKPMIRFATPIWCENRKIGVLILNYSAQQIINSLNSADNQTYGSLYLTDENGHYLFSENKAKNWGNMYEERKQFSLKNDFPVEWEKIIEMSSRKCDCDEECDCDGDCESSGQFETKNGIFSFQEINASHMNTKNLLLKKSAQSLYLVSKIEKNSIVDSLKISRNYITAIILLLSVIISLIIAYFNSKSIITQLKLINREKELSESNHTKDTLFSIISHDLRGPMGNIAGILSLLNSGVLKRDDANKYLKTLSLSIKNTQSLLENLLNWAKNQKEGIILDRKHFLFFDLVKEVKETLLPLADKKNISINATIDDQLIIDADRNMIVLVIRNIISNSIKFTPNNGEIEVSTQREEKELYISISDNGIGMNQDTIEKIFDKHQFVTTNGTNSEVGSGLGLKLCYEFVKAHKGDILVESTISKGTKFTIIIPQKNLY